MDVMSAAMVEVVVSSIGYVTQTELPIELQLHLLASPSDLVIVDLPVNFCYILTSGKTIIQGIQVCDCATRSRTQRRLRRRYSATILIADPF